MNHTTHKKLARRKRRMQRRLAVRQWKDQRRPMLAASNISYELADRDQAIGCGGIGMIHLLAHRGGLAAWFTSSLRFKDDLDAAVLLVAECLV